MRPFVIVFPEPLRGEQLRVFDRIECMKIQPFVPNGSIKSFHIGVLGWFVPGWMYNNVILFLIVHSIIAWLMFSGPLSQRIRRQMRLERG